MDDQAKNMLRELVKEHRELSGLELESDPILKMSGLGKEIWKGVDPDNYVKELREDESDE